MGAHRKQTPDVHLRRIRLPSDWPPLPHNIGKTRSITSIDGRIWHFRIEDEIIRPQNNSDRKIIVLQRMRFLEEDRIEFRFGYYMIGLKPKARGRWVWGQFCLLIPQEDLMAILYEAKKRKWFKTSHNWHMRAIQDDRDMGKKVGEFEKAEISANLELNRSLKRGHQDAKHRRGTFA